MRQDGLIKVWNEERGFGFIEPLSGGDELFVHISAFTPRVRQPSVGQRVSFEVERRADGKKRAKNVAVMRVSRVRTRRESGTGRGRIGIVLLAIPLFLVAYGAITWIWRLPLWVAGIYLLVSVVCFGLYALDKSAAQSGNWRIPESTLLAAGLFGGWPGGLVAQQLLRHKSSKASFQSQFWITVLFNVCGLVYLVYRMAQA
jgi:uncharacterized membrane protein YsdA (DUF1294 family)/cold shock CspA family protein